METLDKDKLLKWLEDQYADANVSLQAARFVQTLILKISDGEFDDAV